MVTLVYYDNTLFGFFYINIVFGTNKSKHFSFACFGAKMIKVVNGFCTRKYKQKLSFVFGAPLIYTRKTYLGGIFRPLRHIRILF